MLLTVGKAPAPLKGTLRPPGDKSISHRALIFCGLATGESRIEGLLVSGDTTATRRAMEQLGASFTDHDGFIVARGIGGQPPSPPQQTLDMGNSGTAMRLLSGVLAAQDFSSTLSGDASLNSRPMGRIIKPLELMGADITAQEGGRAPLHIRGTGQLRGIHYTSPVASAQVKSCVLLAGLFAQGQTSVSEPLLSRDHTERLLPQFGVALGPGISVQGGQSLQAVDLQVPADPSSAAFLAAAALITPGSRIVLESVGMNPTRDGFFRVVRRMGGAVKLRNQRQQNGEPVADLEVSYTPDLQGVDVPVDWIPSMIDEVPILLALAAAANGRTRIRDAEELRVKESDRLAVMAEGLSAMGVRLKEVPDGIDVWGGSTQVATVAAAHDHRCAMSFAVLGLRSDGGARVEGAEYIDTSYPGFIDDLSSLLPELKVERLT